MILKKYIYAPLGLNQGFNTLDITNWDMPNGYNLVSIFVDSQRKTGIDICEVDQGGRKIILYSNQAVVTYAVFHCLFINKVEVEQIIIV